MRQETQVIIEKYKNLNFEIKQLIKLEQRLDFKKILVESKRMEIINIETREKTYLCIFIKKKSLKK